MTAIHNKKPIILLLNGGKKRGATKPVSADNLRVALAHIDEEGTCTQKEHNAAERLIKTIESGSTEHLKKKELNDLLVKLQEPKSSKLMIKLQAALRGAAVRLDCLDSTLIGASTLTQFDVIEDDCPHLHPQPSVNHPSPLVPTRYRPFPSVSRCASIGSTVT